MDFDNLLVEKYRPKTIDELIVDDSIKDLVLEFKTKQQIPNLLFVGPPGTGKSSLSKIIVNDVLKCQYLYINASDENGIDTIRNKVTNFAQTKSIDGKVKVIILDECDGITLQGQQALRNTMEAFSQYVRFILTANFKHKIITPLQSRCQSLILKPNIEHTIKRCWSILKQENVTVDDEQRKQFVELIKNHFPDLRKCINELQKNIINGTLSIKYTTVPYKLVNEIFNHIKAGDCISARRQLIESADEFQGDYQALLKEMLNYTYENISDVSKGKEAMLVIANHLYSSVFAVDHEINCFACLIQLEKILS